MTDQADVVIVGAGLNGAATAFWLTARGVRNVTVVDGGYPAGGASGRGMGLLRTYHANSAEARLAIASLEIFRNWSDVVGGECGYTPAGYLWLSDDRGADEVRSNTEMLAALGASTVLVSADDLTALQPKMRVDDIAVAAYEPAAGYAYGALATDALLAGARRRGALVRTYDPVISVETDGERVTGVLTHSGRIASACVVVAAGAWTVPLLAPLGVTLPIQPRRLTIGRIHAQEPTDGVCAFLDGVIDTSFKPDGNNAALISMRDERYGTPIAPDELTDDVDPRARQPALRRIEHRLPGLGQLVVGRTWTGVDGFTPDFKGVYGATDGPAGLFVCAGSSEKGFKVAPAVGRAMADLVIDGRSDEFELAPFDPTRFAHGADQSYTQAVSALL